MVDTRAEVNPDTAPIAALRAAMKRAGVSRAVLSAGSPEDDYTFTAAAGSSALVVSVAVDPLCPDTPTSLTRLRSVGAIAGVRLRAHDARDEMWLNAPEAYPFWETVQELNLPVDLTIRSDQYNQLSDVIADFPRTRLVIDRLGQGPDTETFQVLPILLEYARYAAVHVRISGVFALSHRRHPHEDSWDRIQLIRDRFGADRLMWGSEFPVVQRHCGYEVEAGLVDGLPFLSARDRDWIQEKTARMLWFD